MTVEGLDQPGTLETDQILVRSMRESDLEAVVAIDAAATGRRRPQYFERMLERTVKEADFQISLVAELDGVVAGCVIATLFYGEYGLVEPSASIDAIGVLEEYRRKNIGRAMLRQLTLNLGALRIEKIRTEVAWDDFQLLSFLKRAGFRPAGRLCLEFDLDPTAPTL